MKPVTPKLTIIGIFILLAYTLGLAESEFESSDSTKIVIVKSEKSLYLYANDSIVKTYKIAVGKKATPTPVGNFKLANKVINPGWFPQGKDPVPTGTSANPIGTRWMGLNEPGYGIHGTNKPSSIGKMASKGCIRMKKQDVEELFALVKLGIPVEIIEKIESVEVVEPIPQFIAVSGNSPIRLASSALIQ